MNRSHVLLFGLFCLACDGSVTLEALPYTLATAQCDAFAACGSSLETLSPAQCSELVAGSIENRYLDNVQHAVGESTVIYDAAAAGRCIDAIRAVGCGETLSVESDACREMFVGTVGLDGECTIDEQCTGDAYCDEGSCGDTGFGRCAARASVGAACASSTECGLGLACRSGVCTAFSRSSTCYGDFDCALDQACLDGVCVARGEVYSAGLGEECSSLGTSRCAGGNSCALVDVDGARNILECRAPVGSGGSCFRSSPDMCPDNEYCHVDGTITLFEGTCSALPATGEPCVESLCRGTDTCIDGTCRSRLGNGAACTDRAECWSGQCVDGLCAATPTTCGG